MPHQAIYRYKDHLSVLNRSRSCHSRAINTLRPGQNGRHFADDVLKCSFVNENIWISRKISPEFVPKFPVNNIPALIQILQMTSYMWMIFAKENVLVRFKFQWCLFVWRIRLPIFERWFGQVMTPNRWQAIVLLKHDIQASWGLNDSYTNYIIIGWMSWATSLITTEPFKWTTRN